MNVEAIPVLRVSDSVRSVAWYARLGYETEWEHRYEPGMPAFVSLAHDGGARMFLSEHTGDARRNTLVYLRGFDVDALAIEFVTEIIEQPWGREVHLLDPDDNRLRVGSARE